MPVHITTDPFIVHWWMIGLAFFVGMFFACLLGYAMGKSAGVEIGVKVGVSSSKELLETQVESLRTLRCDLDEEQVPKPK